MSDPNQPGPQPGGSDPAPEPPSQQAAQPPQPPPYQPPYGQTGAQPPYGQPAGQPPYGAPYRPPPQRGGKTSTWLVVIGVVLLLVCGGCFAVGAVVVNTGRELARELEDLDAPGRPTTVEEGASFELGGLVFQAGWSLEVDGPAATIEGLAVSNEGDEDEVVVSVVFEFHRQGRLLGSISCTGLLVDAGDSSDLDCLTTARRVQRHDRITVQSLA
jgi:hypothetical protein